jgi:hypothetical protein
LIFGVEMREKTWSTPRVTIHQRPEICHLGMHFVHKWVRKRPYTLCKSCRGILDLQLSYLHLGALQFNYLELHSVKQGYLKIFAGTGRSGTRRPRHGPTGPGRRGWAATWRARCSVPHHQRAPLIAAPPSRPFPLVPRAERARAVPRRP